jgi:hypothetical protein
MKAASSSETYATTQCRNPEDQFELHYVIWRHHGGQYEADCILGSCTV